jgi:hypothetical protein
MRYNAFYGELPLEAFKPIGGRMRLYGGGDPISAVSDAVSSAVSGVGDVVQGAVNTVGDLGAQIDQTVRNTLPGGWTTAALLAGGYYYAPEIGAYLNSTTGATVPLAEVADAGAVATPVTSGNVIATELPSINANAFANLGATDASLGAAGLANAGLPAVAAAPVVASTVAPTVASTAAPAVASTVAPEALSPVVPAVNSTTALSQVAPVTAESAAAGGAGTTLGQLAPTLGAAAGGAAGTITGSTIGDLALISGGTGLGSALITSDAAKNAANIQSAAAQGASQLQGQMFNTINQQQTPYRTAGYNALNQLGGLGTGQYQQYDAQGNPTTMGTGTGYLTHQFGPADLQAGLAPNYDFMLQQGQMANQRAANVGGGALGGNALQGLNKYTQDYAGNAYQNAFTNYQNQRTNIYNTLAGIAGIGQQGQTATNTAGSNLANAQSQLGVGSAAAQAAGQIGTASAYGNALGSLGSGLTLATLLNQRGNATLPIA